jgi:hypothetical protein
VKFDLKHLVQPEIVKNDGNKMTKPQSVLILCTVLGIHVNVQTIEIDIDELIFLMMDTTKLATSAKIDRAWTTRSYSIVAHKPKSTLEDTDRVIKILDAEYKKVDLKAVV